MKVFFLIAIFFIHSPAFSKSDFLSIYNSDGRCELRLHGKEGGYLGQTQKQGVIPVEGKGCNITFSAVDFEEKYEFCALSGISVQEGTSLLSCNFYQSDNGEYVFFSSPGVKACKYTCIKK